MGDTLRIAYLLPGFCADEDDPCIPVITEFIKEMAQHVEAVIYTAGYPHREGRYVVHGVPVYCTGKTSQGTFDKIIGWREVIRAIALDHGTQPFDIVHGFWGTAPGYAAAKAGRKIGVPSVVSLAGGEFADFPDADYGTQRSRRGRWLLQRSLASATSITSGSDWLGAKVPAQFHSRLTTIPLGLDTKLFSPGDLRNGHRLLAVAAMIPLKDYPTLLRATAYARKSFSGLTLSIVGWKENKVELQRVEHLIAELDLVDAVEILGECHHSEMPKVYRSHDLFLHASRYEAQGMAILEALATGLPVISSDVGIVPSLPEDLVYRFEPGNWEEMGGAIVRSLQDGTHAKRAMDRGPALVKTEFDIRKTVERFLALYSRNCGRN